MSSDDSGALQARRRRGRDRATWGEGLATSLGFATFEQAQGAGVTAIPVEGYRWTQGATVWRQTSADRSVTFADGTFDPAPIKRGELDFSQEDTAQNLTVRVARENPVALLFIAYNPATPVYVTAWRRHRSDEEEVIIFSGRVVSWEFNPDDEQVTLTCAPVSNAFRRRAPSLVYQSQCNWALFGPGCGLDKEAYRDSGFVLAVSGATVRSTAFALRPDGWYRSGWAELGNLEKRSIVAHVGDTITLQVPFSSINVGDAIDAFPGCDRSELTCEGKFDNLVHHLGFPRIPTRNPYSGSIV